MPFFEGKRERLRKEKWLLGVLLLKGAEWIGKAGSLEHKGSNENTTIGKEKEKKNKRL